MSSAMPLALEGKGVPLWLDSSEGTSCWTLIITPKELAQKSLDPPWTFRVRDPQGDVRDLGVRKEPDSCDEVVREATQIFLDELSASNFDRMSDRIIAWTNKWSMRDGRTLVSITQLVYRKATDDAASCVLCARLCRRMMEKISSDVRDEETRDAQGKLITGGHLFRKYLLESCKEDFERYCSSPKAQTTNTCDTQAISWTELEDGGDNELESPGGAHGPTQEAERRGLGTILFIGELFKVQMSTERIMHQCVQKLLGNVDNPAEEEIESVCKLLTTVGELLDTPRAHAHMDVHFTRLKELTKKPTLSSRMQFMLQDLIELRAQDWRARAQTARPTPIAQIHEIAAEEKAAEEKDAMHRQYTNSRGDSERGGDRRDSEHVGPDGWTVAGPSALLPPVKAGGLSNSGNINKATPATFGPGSVFAGKNANKRDSISREASTFHASQSGGAEPVTAPQSGQPPSQKLSVDPSSAAGIQPTTGQYWPYPPSYGGYVDPNWAAAYGQWYMHQHRPPHMSSQQHSAHPQPMPVPYQNAPPPSQYGHATAGGSELVYATYPAAQTAATSGRQYSKKTKRGGRGKEWRSKAAKK